jgi:Leucine Rich repeat
MDPRILDRLRQNDATLTELKLGYNQIGHAGAQALADAFSENTRLTTLYLGYNQIGHAGAQALADAFSENTRLTTLYLGYNQIGDAGTQDLANALLEKKTLTALYLWGNRIGDAGAQGLAGALQRNKTLTALRLGVNLIGDVGAQALAGVLRANKTLTELSLWDNQIGNVGAQALADALLENKTLTELDLNRNRIGDAGANALAISITFTRGRANFDGVNASEAVWAAATRRVNKVNRALIVLAMAWRRGRGAVPTPDLQGLSRDTYGLLRKAVISTIFDTAWDEEPEPQQPQRRRQKVAACIGCLAPAPQWAEEGNPSKAYCGSYCQMLHYTGLPDLRTASVEQLVSAFSR